LRGKILRDFGLINQFFLETQGLDFGRLTFLMVRKEDFYNRYWINTRINRGKNIRFGMGEILSGWLLG